MDDHSLKKFLSNEMLKKNMLASNVIYLSLAHKKNLLEKYFKELNKVFTKMKYYN